MCDRIPGDNVLKWLDGQIDAESQRRTEELAEKDARIAELEAVLCRVSNELNDPMGEHWCDNPREDRALLENLLMIVDAKLGEK